MLFDRLKISETLLINELMKNLKWDRSFKQYNKCMVEEYTHGKDYRIFLHKHKIVDIVEKESGKVKGNGESTLLIFSAPEPLLTSIQSTQLESSMKHLELESTTSSKK